MELSRPAWPDDRRLFRRSRRTGRGVSAFVAVLAAALTLLLF